MNSAEKYKYIINSKIHRKIQTIPKILQTFTQTIKIMLNLGKISKQQKSHQNRSRKFKQNAKIGEKSAL